MNYIRLNLDGTGEKVLTSNDAGSTYLFAGNKIIFDNVSSINIDGNGPT